jgi:general secretion pathway protein E/type IV pilus assembly protein PilB
MGVKPFLVASSVKAIMAQRLLRRVCKNCAAPYQPEPYEVRVLDLDDEFINNSQLVKGKGCSECGNTGYKGRMGIYEIFVLTEDIQHLIYKKVSASVIRDAAREGGMRTLRGDAIRKAAAGSTTLEEVIRVTVTDSE